MLGDDLPKREASQASGMYDLVHEGLLLDTFWPSNQRFLGKPRVVFGDLKQYSLGAVMRETAAVIVLGFPLIFVPASGHESDSKCICKSP